MWVFAKVKKQTSEMKFFYYKVFDKHGEFLRVIDTDASPLYGPQDVALMGNRLAVVDSGNHCVKCYNYC